MKVRRNVQRKEGDSKTPVSTGGCLIQLAQRQKVGTGTPVINPKGHRGEVRQVTPKGLVLSNYGGHVHPRMVDRINN